MLGQWKDAKQREKTPFFVLYVLRNPLVLRYNREGRQIDSYSVVMPELIRQ